MWNKVPKQEMGQISASNVLVVNTCYVPGTVLSAKYTETSKTAQLGPVCMDLRVTWEGELWTGNKGASSTKMHLSASGEGPRSWWNSHITTVFSEDACGFCRDKGRSSEERNLRNEVEV